jgi:hypothetical protein
MKIKAGPLKRITLPLLLFTSLVINVLFLFNIINTKINLEPPTTKKLQNKTIKHFWDSPIIYPDTIRSIDSVDSVKSNN